MKPTQDQDARFDDALPPVDYDLPPDVTESAPPFVPENDAPDLQAVKITRKTQSVTETPDRLPPYSQAAEKGVLGCILLSPETNMPVALERMETYGEAFYDLRHRVIWETMVKMYDARATIDLITLSERLKDDGKLDSIGGVQYLKATEDEVPSAANITYYLDIVAEKYQLRKTIFTCTNIVSKVYDFPGGDSDELLDGIERDILDIRGQKRIELSSGMTELVRDAIGDIEKLYENRGNLTGLATGYVDLDRLTNGLQPGEMFVLAARPSMGKTSLAMNIAEYVAVELGLPVGVFSLEMTRRALSIRMVASRALVNLRRVRRENDSAVSVEVSRLAQAASQLGRCKMRIDDTPGLSVMQLRARARRMKQMYDTKLIVIDYLQLMCSPSKRGNESRQQEVSDISCGVKALAKELDVAVLALSQLNREVERKVRKPNLSDLRESGSIEQDADAVAFLYKPDSEDEVDAYADAMMINLLLAKQRNGPTGDVSLTFMKPFTRFVNAAKVSEEDVPQQTDREQLEL